MRAIGRMMRLTVAAVASYFVASLVFPHSLPLLAPLSALLVIQLTPVSILTSGIQRVASVVVGVSVAVGFSSLVGITWWSLGTVIALSLLIGQALRLGSNLLEVPISAMLVLGVGARTTEAAAWQRIAETLVGAGVGVLSNLLFPPKVTSEDAASAIEGLGDDLAQLLESASNDVASDELSIGDLKDRASRWLDEARRLTHDIPNVGSALLGAEESRRLNLRALGTADFGPGLRHGMEALEHSALALRSMFRSLVEATHSYDAESRELSAEVRTAVALLLADLAAAVGSFGRLVYAEAQPGDNPPDLAELRDALETLQEARVKFSDILLIDPRADAPLAALASSLLATVQRLLQELGVDDRARRHVRRQPRLPQRLVTQPRRLGDASAKLARRNRRHGDPRR
ncbi:MAG: aromatic acid exporter family protein [Nocardioidaceae bacterium]